MLRDVLGDSEWLGLLHWVFEDELLCHLRIFVVPEAQEATTQMWIHVSWFRTRQTLLPKCTSCYRVLCIRGLAVCWTGFVFVLWYLWLCTRESHVGCSQGYLCTTCLLCVRGGWVHTAGGRGYRWLCRLCGCAKEAVLESCSAKKFLLIGNRCSDLSCTSPGRGVSLFDEATIV